MGTLFFVRHHGYQLLGTGNEVRNFFGFQGLRRHTGQIVDLLAKQVGNFAFLPCGQGAHGGIAAVEHQGEAVGHGELFAIQAAHFLEAAALLILVLLVKPTGLLGKPVREKV